MALPTAKTLPVHRASQPGKMTMDRHWIITAMDHAAEQRLAQTVRDMPATDRHIKSAIVAVKVGEAVRHLHECVKVLRVEEPTFRPTMSRDHI